MKTRLSLIFLLNLFLLACTSDKIDQPSSSTELNTETPAQAISLKPFAASLDSLVKQGGPCTDDAADCMKIKIVWPVVQNGSEKIRQIMNDSIQAYSLKQMEFGPPQENGTLASHADSLIARYELEYKMEQAFISGQAVEITGKINFREDIANLEILNYAYLGGAHPNYYTQAFNFDTNTGKVIKYSDFIKDAATFDKMIADKFIEKIAKISGEQVNIEDFFWGSGFQLPKNFILGKDALELFYNPYEAAAYAMGEINIKIPYQELEGIIER